MDGPNELTSGSSEAKSVFEQRARYDSPANIFTIERPAVPRHVFVEEIAQAIDIDTAPPSFAPIGGLLEQLEHWYIGAKSPQPGECLDLAMLAVDRADCGQGIAQKLVSVCLENGAAKGYRRAITMATNRTSQRVFQKLGFNELFSVSYKDYTFDGNRVFASIEPDDRTALLERVL